MAERSNAAVLKTVLVKANGGSNPSLSASYLWKMSKILFIFLFLFPLYSYSQIKVDKAGDGWDLKIDSALSLIRTVDLQKYELLDSVCQEISFWVSDFSSNELSKEGIGRIYVATGDVKLGSINNLAVVLVHESLHLLFLRKGMDLNPVLEENLCYRYELEFINELPNVEPWLVLHTLRQIQLTQQ